MGKNVKPFFKNNVAVRLLLIFNLKLNLIFMHSGVHGHLEGELPWASCDEPLRPAMAKIVGKKYIFLIIPNF
jgi:hypothetical protein